MSSPLLHQFDELTALLRDTRCYWGEWAYFGERLAWAKMHPELVAHLQGLPVEKLEQCARSRIDLAKLMRPYLPFVSDLQRLAAVAELPRHSVAVAPRFHSGIPGRKWQQVQAFAGCVSDTLPVLEWCSGKSHLGFFLQHCTGQSVTALEWDAGLVAEANARAARDAVALRSHQVDVLKAGVEAFLHPQHQVVALHACGDLHERLLQLCMDLQPAQLHLAPCCYHKRQESEYRGISSRGRQAGLTLHKQDLHTAVMETVTSGATEQRQRRQLQAMRLGFDELQREVRGVAEYLPVPSLPASWSKRDFSEFCRHCAQLKGLALPSEVDWEHYRRRGEQRFNEVSALDLVRFSFRRPIEVWLALDRALALQEQGYRVRLGTFCPSDVTPRNLLIQAWRDSA